MRIKKLKLIANDIRQDVIKMLCEAGSGHTAGSLGMTDVLTALYFEILKHKPKQPKWTGRDYFILSNGHICPAMYAAMANAGYFPKKELMTLRKFGSRLQGHPHRESLPGLETTSGPLGSGISQAAGMALALKMDKKKNKIYCLTSDGGHNEGNTWEGVMFAAKYKLDNLIVIMDRNKIQLSGNTKEIMPMKSLKKKYKAFNWNVLVINGNNMREIVTSLKLASKLKGKPTMIIALNTPGKGVSFVEGKAEWHGITPKEEECDKAIKELQARRKKIERMPL